MQNKTIYTIGSSNHTPEEFIKLLKNYQIQALIDVRKFPTSKFAYFKKENLVVLLKNNEIDYYYLGKNLGGYREGGYELYLKTKDFQEGLKELMKIAQNKVTVIMCSERFPWKCHRRFIGQTLQEQTWQVIHIIDNKRHWIPKATF